MPRTCVRTTHTTAVALATTVALLLLAPAARAQETDHPIPVRGKDRITTAISPVDDEDVYLLRLFPGDRLVAKVVEAGPSRTLEPRVLLEDPGGVDAFPEVRSGRNGKRTLKFTASDAGVHTLRMLGAAGGFAGATGNYSLTFNVKRAKVARSTFDDPAGGAISVRFGVTDGGEVTIGARTRKGGVELTELKRPDGTPEPEFANSLKVPAKHQRSAKLKRFPVTGGGGMYELVGTYLPGSKVKVSVNVKHTDAKRGVRLFDDEPGFHQQIAPWPREAIEGVGFNFIGRNLLVQLDSDENKTLPRIWLGGIEIDPAVVTQQDQQYSFPVPAGLTPNRSYALSVENFDGQGATLADAFFYILPPELLTLDQVEGGPAGGRGIELSGNRFRSGTLVIFDDVVVQPRVFGSTRIEVTSPPHAAGTVDVTIRDEFGQTSTLPNAFTYLDIGSNHIESISPGFLMATGGQEITVTGADFVADSVITLDGRDVNAQLISPTVMRFTAPPIAGGDYELQVLDQYEQPSSVYVSVRGFLDATNSAIPVPNTGVGKVDGWRATRVLHGDVDGDGNDDVVLLRPEQAFDDELLRSRVRVLLGDGDGGFTDDTENALPVVENGEDWRAHDGALADIDDDQDLDLVIVHTDAFAVDTDGNPTRPSIRVLENDQGVFSDATDTALAGMPDYDASEKFLDHLQGHSLLMVDVDGQNGPDIVVLDEGTFLREVVTDPGDPGDPSTIPPIPPTPPTYQRDYYGGLRVLLNDGNGVFTRKADAIPSPATPTELGEAPTDLTYSGEALAAGAVGSNGDIHLIITRADVAGDPQSPGTFLRSSTFLENDGSGTFTDTSATALPQVSAPDFLQAASAAFADIDGDGDDDLVLALATRMVAPGAQNPALESATRIYMNDGNTAFTRIGAPTIESSTHSNDRDSNQARAIAIGDLTGDGKPDIVLTSTNPPNAGERGGRVLVQSGGGFIRGEEAFPAASAGDNLRGRAIDLLDIDRDGDLDVLIGRDESDETVRNTRVLINPVACVDFTAGANGFDTPFKFTNGVDPDDPDPVQAAKYLEVTTLEAGRIITLAPSVTYTDVGGGADSGDFRLEMRINGEIARDIEIPSIASGTTEFVHDYVRISFDAIGDYCVELRVDGALTRRETFTVVRAP